MTVAEYIAQKIVDRGVHDVFLLSGGGMMYMLDALGKHPNIKVHCHNHEQDTGIAAEAYARITGKPAYCFVTSGPGGLNAVEAIAECWVDSVPVIFFVGQNKVSQTTRGSGIKGLRQHGASEIDTIAVIESITKASYFVERPRDIQNIMMDSVSCAVAGRPGPVVIQVPLDIQSANFTDDMLLEREITAAFLGAKRPLVLAGAGVRIGRALDELQSFVERHGIPLVTTQAAKDLVPYAYPWFVGHVGMKGDRAGNTAIQEADFIFCVGASLHVFTTGYELGQFSPDAKIMYIDRDPAQLARCKLSNVRKIDLDVAVALSYADYNIDNEKQDGAWLRGLIQIKTYLSVYKEPHKTEEGRLNIYKALEVINEWSDNYDTIISDAGSSFYAVGQAWQLKGGQRFISSNGLGTMGWALPAATGSYIANGMRVLCFTGDGSFMTGVNELSVLRKENANVITFVFNNEGYVSIRNTQDTFFGGNYVGTDKDHGVNIPNIGSIAFAYNISHALVSNETELLETLKIVEKAKGPFIVEIKTNVKQEIIPTVQSYTDENGKIVSGNLGEMYPPLGIV